MLERRFWVRSLLISSNSRVSNGSVSVYYNQQLFGKIIVTYLHENASIVKKNMYVLEILVRYCGFGPFLCRWVKGYGPVIGVYSMGFSCQISAG